MAAALARGLMETVGQAARPRGGRLATGPGRRAGRPNSRPKIIDERRQLIIGREIPERQSNREPGRCLSPSGCTPPLTCKRLRSRDQQRDPPAGGVNASALRPPANEAASRSVSFSDKRHDLFIWQTGAGR
jgi:hypothetical protein